MSTSPTVLDEVDELSNRRDRSLRAARAAVGIAPDRPPSMANWYPVLALSGLVLVADLQTLVLSALAPEVSATLGISRAEFAASMVFKTVIIAAAGLAAAAVAQRKGARGRLCIVTSFVSVAALAAGTYTTSLAGLLVVLAAGSIGLGTLRAIEPSFLVDVSRPGTRLRALSATQAARSAGAVLAAVVVFTFVTELGLSWRGALLSAAALSAVASVAALRLRDPGYGTLDDDAVAATVRSAPNPGERTFSDENTDDSPTDDDPAVLLGPIETWRRIFLIPLMRWVLLADVLVGVLLTPFATYLAFFLRSRWNLDPGSRLLVLGTLPLLAVAGVIGFSGRLERAYRRDPARLLRLAAALVALSVALLVGGLAVTWLVPAMIMFAAMGAAMAATGPILTVSVLAVVPPRMRPQAAALHTAILFGAAGISGVMLIGSVERRFGTTLGLGALAFPAAAGAFVLIGASRLIDHDIDRRLEETIEAEELREVRASGRHLPMLACRHIDFSYGSLRVLFGVDFDVDADEMIALLGTNGAGKSTLLRVISGLGLPTRGSVRLDGADITFIDAERRLALGITQVAGGQAVFPPLTVVENLRVSGFTHGRHHRAVDRGIEATFAAFPRLAERRNQLAATLSGGERQMLGLGKAFILEPRLLLIDELSLGLAPKVVGELLDMVREINARGTAVVLVEQSVNVALSLVERAYFMEKGEVRFEGRSLDLLDRPDLLRSVFLEGATTNGTRRRRKRS